MSSKEMEKRSSRPIEMGLRKRTDSSTRSRGGICRDPRRNEKQTHDGELGETDYLGLPAVLIDS